MTKPELGTKRLCASCSARFYDLLHSPITCPKCGSVFAATPVHSQTRLKAPPEPVRKFAPAGAETSGAQFVPLEDADAEADGDQTGVIPEEEDDDELPDEGLNGAALIEDSDQEEGDVVEVIIEGED
jgi:uncharacterized protein (TIGR02300 family)